MKLNWGWGIALLFSCFVVFMTSLVFRSFQQNCDLVHEDYYSEELKYQEHINKQIKTGERKKRVVYKMTKKELIIKFPEEQAQTTTSGEILFFRPSDKKKDLKVNIHLENGEQHFPLELFSKGFYKIKIDWQSADTKFYDEESIIL
jgi:hypothetical protein